ncbi:MAG: hypothetical protein KJO18_07510 [Acidimicrobiia bacterium]|nr:hypothetical protein [Acidimicrobiia bacterium]
MIPELGKRLRGFRWKFFGMWGLIALLLEVMNYRFITSQLDHNDALREDMRLIVDTVADDVAEARLEKTIGGLRSSNTGLERYPSTITHELLTPIRAIGRYVDEPQRNVSETVTHLLERAMARPTSIDSVPVSA